MAFFYLHYTQRKSVHRIPMFTTPHGVFFQLSFFQHGDLLDHTGMHCPRFFTAAMKCSGTLSSPLWQITLPSLLGISGFELAFTIVQYLIPYKPSPPLRKPLLSKSEDPGPKALSLALTKQQLSFLYLTHHCAIEASLSLRAS